MIKAYGDQDTAAFNEAVDEHLAAVQQYPDSRLQQRSRFDGTMDAVELADRSGNDPVPDHARHGFGLFRGESAAACGRRFGEHL